MPRKRDRRPTVYLDGNIISVMSYRGINMAAAHYHMTTLQWWDTERAEFQIFSSAFTERELRAGVYPGQEEAVRCVRRMKYLPYNPEVRECSEKLLEVHAVPATKPGDATQLAIAIVHRIDYLLTWNYAHLANAQVQASVDRICRHHRWRAPVLVSPETIPRVALGHTIQRNDDD
jgi:hypothetical protein